jgi:hypothetical protein
MAENDFITANAHVVNGLGAGAYQACVIGSAARVYRQLRHGFDID